MARTILCVAEKPNVAKAVAQHLHGGNIHGESIGRLPWIKNWRFDFDFGPPWGRCNVIMTSVAGHMTEMDFPDAYRSWRARPPSDLFEAPILKTVADDKKPIAQNIKQHARFASSLFIWTDCDREGENIGGDIRSAAQEANRGIEVKRAQFSNYERDHILRAARNPVNLDDRQINAVSARQELDLRLGAAFTRFTTLTLQPITTRTATDDKSKVVSYGSCQFPTLGFVVDRYFKVRNFKPEKFWGISVNHERDGISVGFSWHRHRLFDRPAVIVLYEKCLKAGLAKVTKIQTKPTSRWRPLPLTTVELQKLGSSYLRMSSAQVMEIAENLYREGWISYPRTETDQFDREFDLKRYIQRQTQDNHWGTYAQELLDGRFREPRRGTHNDRAHPPIHPVNYKVPSTFRDDQRRVYEFVVRRFLACCSEDAKGESTTVEIHYGPETFSASGVVVLAKNYLDVYTYEHWSSSQPMPVFTLHETFEPRSANITEGKTTAPTYLTEPELIALMDANGIGTDATMAEHIKKIQDREYVMTRQSSHSSSNTTSSRGRGRGRGRNATDTTTHNSSGSGAIQQFIPTTLGVALIEGYDSIGLETSLAKPFLRRDMETQMRAICAGQATRAHTVAAVLEQYRAVYTRANGQADVLRQTARKFMLPEQA